MDEDELLSYYAALVRDPDGGDGSPEPRQPSKPLDVRVVQRRLLAHLRALIPLCEDFEKLQRQLRVPGARELEEIAAGQGTLSLEAHLAALCDLLAFDLSLAIQRIEEHGRHTEESLRQAAAPHPVILGALARLVRERSRPDLP